MNRGWETADVLHRHALCIADLHVLVENGEDLVVKNLKLADAVHHLLQRLSTRKGHKHSMRICHIDKYDALQSS